MDSVGGGGGGSSRNFPGSIFSGGRGGGSSRNFPGSVFCRVTDIFQLTPLTDPKFVFFKHVMCFARIMSALLPEFMSTNCPNLGGSCPPCPPSRTPMMRADSGVNATNKWQFVFKIRLVSHIIGPTYFTSRPIWME